MDKKDIYEHLAKIYLDASSKKKKRSRAYPSLFRNLFIVSVFILLGLSTTIISSSAKRRNLNSETALILQNWPAKLNFNFDPAKKEIFTINLNRLNLGHAKALVFAVRNTHPKDAVSLRIEFTNAFKEKSEVYARNLPGKWQDYKFELSEFKKINDWSEITSLSFAVEEWNTRQKKGVVYLDNIRLLKT